MLKCLNPLCSCNLPSDALFCPHCGEKVNLNHPTTSEPISVGASVISPQSTEIDVSENMDLDSRPAFRIRDREYIPPPPFVNKTNKVISQPVAMTADHEQVDQHVPSHRDDHFIKEDKFVGISTEGRVEKKSQLHTVIFLLLVVVFILIMVASNNSGDSTSSPPQIGTVNNAPASPVVGTSGDTPNYSASTTNSQVESFHTAIFQNSNSGQISISINTLSQAQADYEALSNCQSAGSPEACKKYPADDNKCVAIISSYENQNFHEWLSGTGYTKELAEYDAQNKCNQSGPYQCKLLADYTKCAY